MPKEFNAYLDGYQMTEANEWERARTICHFVSALAGKPIPRDKIARLYYDEDATLDITKAREVMAQYALMALQMSQPS